MCKGIQAFSAQPIYQYSFDYFGSWRFGDLVVLPDKNVLPRLLLDQMGMKVGLCTDSYRPLSAFQRGNIPRSTAPTGVTAFATATTTFTSSPPASPCSRVSFPRKRTSTWPGRWSDSSPTLQRRPVRLRDLVTDLETRPLANIISSHFSSLHKADLLYQHKRFWFPFQMTLFCMIQRGNR